MNTLTNNIAVIENATPSLADYIRDAMRSGCMGDDNKVYIRYHGTGVEGWMSAQEVAEAGCPFSWIDNIVAEYNDEFDEDADSEAYTNHDYEVQDSEGLVDAYCSYSNGWGFCDWAGFLEALTSGMSEWVIRAGRTDGYSLEQIQDAYQGEFESDRDFVEQYCEDTLEIPEHLAGYIDWDAITRDYMMDFWSADGHYFRYI